VAFGEKKDGFVLLYNEQRAFFSPVGRLDPR
jgi:hypothetical protein